MFVFIFDFTIHPFQCEIGGVMENSGINIMAKHFPSIYYILNRLLLILSHISNSWSHFAKTAKCTNWKSRCLTLSFYLTSDWNVIILFIRFASDSPQYLFHFMQCNSEWGSLFFLFFFLHSFQNLWTFLLNSWHFCLTCMDRYIYMYVSNRINILILPFVTVIQCKRGDIEFNIIVRTLFVEFQSDG